MKLFKTCFLTLAIAVMVIKTSVAQQKDIASIGSSVSTESATSWTENYKAKFPKEAPGFVFGRYMVEELISEDNLAGIYIFNGLDEQGNLKMILRGADNKGEMLSLAPYGKGKICPPSCTVTNDLGSKIKEKEANDLIARFQTKFPERSKGYLFGINIFLDVLAQMEVEGMYFGNAIKEDDSHTIVMVGVDGDGNILWANPADNGLPCPPSCPKKYEGVSVTAKK